MARVNSPTCKACRWPLTTLTATDTYIVDANGLPSAPIDNASSGMTPFGFSFNDNDFLVVSEAFGGAPGQGAASSYSSDPAGLLSVITGSLHNKQTASCWVVIPNNGTRAIVSNTGSGTISTYNIDGSGMLTLANAVAADLGRKVRPEIWLWVLTARSCLCKPKVANLWPFFI
jgi:hypothetical protein